MKKNIILYLIIFISFNAFSQISFDKGYFINNTNQKVECLIKNSDWLDNPDSFEYKLSSDADTKIGTLKEAKVFEIYNECKYIRKSVNIDVSEVSLSKLSKNRNPIFEEKSLFLKVLIEGEASLYSYSNGVTKRFFYGLKGYKPEQLVYKSYITTGSKIGENTMYKQQLLNNFKCSSAKVNSINNIEYKQSQLMSFFVRHNECVNSNYLIFQKSKQKGAFNLSIRPGINLSSLFVNHKPSTTLDANLDNEISLRLGLELEVVLPFNKNKWGVFIEPTYQSFKSEKEVDRGNNLKVDYSSIELPVGVRHYFFINDKSKIFINGSVVLDFPSKSTIVFDNGLNSEITSLTNFAFGIGYKFNNKYALEIRHYTNREVLKDRGNWFSDYKTLSFIFGYTIF